MGSESLFRGKCLQKCVYVSKKVVNQKSILGVVVIVTLFGSFFHLDSLRPNLYAYAYGEEVNKKVEEVSVKETLQGEGVTFTIAKKEQSSCEQPKEDLSLQAEAANKSSALESRLYDVVGEAPIKEMVPFIAQHDQRVAALIVGIAKKESNWGKASPSKNGNTCYNYWGYKGAGTRGTSMGYGCFGSAQEGVDVIGKRIGDLVNKDLNTPSKMIVWKCGSAACAGHDPQSVRKWISDVDMYYRKVVTVEG